MNYLIKDIYSYIDELKGVDDLSPVIYTGHEFSSSISVTGNISVTGTVDGVDIATRDAVLSAHISSDGSSHSFIDQSVVSGANVTFGTIGCGDVTTTGDYLLANGNYVGISANERLEFYTAGYAAFMGCKVGIGVTDPDQTLEVNGIVHVEDYLYALGGIHVGGTSDPGIDNLVVDGNFTLTAGGTTKWVAPGAGTLSAAATAAADGDCLMLMAGAYTETATIAITGKSLSILGMGPEVSIIQCTGCNGIDGDTSAADKHITLKDFALCTTDAGTYTAIELEGDAVASNAIRQFHIENINIRPYDHAADYWATGVRLIDGWNSRIIGCNFRGKNNDVSMSYGIDLSNASINVQMSGNQFYFMDKAINVGGTAEGSFVCDAIVVYANYGVYWAPATGESLAKVSGSHFDVFKRGIYTNDVHWSEIYGNMILRRAGEDFVGIECLNAAQITITGNVILAALTGDTENGIVLDTVTYGTVTGNSIRGCETDIWLKAGSDNNTVFGNVGDGATNHVLDQGANNGIMTKLSGSAALNIASDLSLAGYLKLHITDADGDTEGEIWYDASEDKLKFRTASGVETITST